MKSRYLFRNQNGKKNRRFYHFDHPTTVNNTSKQIPLR